MSRHGRERAKLQGIGRRVREIVDCLREHGPAGPTQIARALGSDKGTIARALSALHRRQQASSLDGKRSAI